jgi:hypothetical protein
LGHEPLSLDRYMPRGRVHAEVAELPDRTVKTTNKHRPGVGQPKNGLEVGRAGLEPATNGL